MPHVLVTPGFKQAQIKFYQYKYCSKAPFFIYANCESILEQSGRQVRQTFYSQQNKVSASKPFLLQDFITMTNGPR